jgi:density-regulated protein DRP1
LFQHHSGQRQQWLLLAMSDDPSFVAALVDESLGPDTNTPAPLSGGLLRDPRYPLRVTYCNICGVHAELHEYLSRAQLERCEPYLRAHAPELFPEKFPEEAAAAAEKRLAKLQIRADADGADGAEGVGGGDGVVDEDEGPGALDKKVAVPVPQKGTAGKKKKVAAEIVVTLSQRKGKKQVTVVYGLDLFGIKLTDATKAAKKKFATGSSVARSSDNRDVIEIQGTRLEDFCTLVHKEFGVPKKSIFILEGKGKGVKRNPFDSDSDSD